MARRREVDRLASAWYAARFQRAKRLPRLAALLKEMRRPNRDARRGVPVDQVVTINALLGGSDRRGAR